MNDTSKTRSLRGLELARTKHQFFRRIDDDIWLVPSATKSETLYVVTVSRKLCTCPDFEDGGTRCKHLWAAAYLENEITLIDGTHLRPPPVMAAADRETTIDLGGGS